MIITKCDFCMREIDRHAYISFCSGQGLARPDNDHTYDCCYSCAAQILPEHKINFKAEEIESVPSCIKRERDRCELLVLRVKGKLYRDDNRFIHGNIVILLENLADNIREGNLCENSGPDVE